MPEQSPTQHIHTKIIQTPPAPYAYISPIQLQHNIACVACMAGYTHFCGAPGLTFSP